MAEPEVPADNNSAERSLRHLVISRKVSGGTRSEQGTESKMTLASLFGTWRAPAQPPRVLIWAGNQHLQQCFLFYFHNGKAPMGFDSYPVSGIPTPTTRIIGAPLVGRLLALGTVQRGFGNLQTGRIAHIVGVSPFAFSIPRPGTGFVGVPQRHVVVDVHLGGVGENLSAPRPQPFTRHDTAILVAGEIYLGQTLLDQHLGPGVLTVAVVVHPMPPIVA